MENMKCFRLVIEGSKRIITKYINTNDIENNSDWSLILDEEERKTLGTYRKTKIVRVDPITHKIFPKSTAIPPHKL